MIIGVFCTLLNHKVLDDFLVQFQGLLVKPVTHSLLHFWSDWKQHPLNVFFRSLETSQLQGHRFRLYIEYLTTSQRIFYNVEY